MDVDAIEVLPPCQALTLAQNGTGSVPTASPAKSTACLISGQYILGEVVTLTPLPGAGNHFDHWVSTVSVNSSNQLVMPDAAHTVTAYYVANAGVGKYDDTNASIQFSSGWTALSNATGPYNRTYRYSNAVGKTATFWFTGSGVKLVFDRYTNRGVLEIKIDGVVVMDLNQIGATRQWQQEWVSGVLGAGDHKLELRHKSGSVVDVDAIEVQ